MVAFDKRSKGEDQMNPHCTRLIAFARQLIEQLPDSDLRAAFLFGSAAWGDADATSDLDIMLLLDRPAGYREVTRVRLADIFGGRLADGPLFADLDRISAKTFIERVQAGDWAVRVVNSVILRDTDEFYARLRAQVSSAFLQPSARAERFLARKGQAEESRKSALLTLGTDDLLAMLHIRLALQHAGAALIELSGKRVSPSHFVESLEQTLSGSDPRLFSGTLSMLALNAPYEAVSRSLQAYDVFADTLKRWMQEKSLTSQLSQEDLAWAQHTYGKQEEIAYKVVTTSSQTKSLPSLLYYLDGLFQVPICIQFSKIFLFRSSGQAERMSIPDFHIALQQEEPDLYNEWLAALRLSSERDRVLEGAEVVSLLLAMGRATMETDIAYKD
jgi:predicted nucleotidyltransferase